MNLDVTQHIRKLMTYKNIGLGSVLFFITIITLKFIHTNFLNCESGYTTHPPMLGTLDSLIGHVLPILYYLIPVGLVLLFVAFFQMRRSRGVSITGVVAETITLVLILLVITSVWLASLNSARSKGPNAAVMSMLNNLRAQAEIYYDTNQRSYQGMCESEPEISDIFRNIRSVSFKQGALCAKWSGAIKCFSERDEYAASAKLPNTIASRGVEFYCVDSTGYASRVSKQAEGTACEYSFLED